METPSRPPFHNLGVATPAFPELAPICHGCLLIAFGLSVVELAGFPRL